MIASTFSRIAVSGESSVFAAGNTVVLITHDNSIAVQAQRIIRLEDGHVIYDGDARDPKAVVSPSLTGEGAGA